MSNIFTRVVNFNIYALVFLMPLFFLPFSFEVFEFNKQYLLFFLASSAFFAWLAKMALIDKEFRFKRTPLDKFILGFLLLAVLSAIFSVDKNSSLYGFYGRFNGGIFSILSLAVLYFIVTNNLDAKRLPGLIKTFIFSGFLAVLFSYLAVFGALAKFAFLPGVMRQIIFNPTSASLEGLSIFLAVFVAFLVGTMMIVTERSKAGSFFYWLILVASLGLIALIDFTAAWIVLLITLVLFVVLSLWKRLFRDNVNRLLIPILLIVIAGVGIPFKSQSVISGLPIEQVLSQTISWDVGLKAAIDSPKSAFLGSGIGAFHYNFAKEKPLSFNQNWLWQIRFDRAGSHLAEILGTTGFLGILSYLAVIAVFLMMSYLLLKKSRSTLPLLMIFIALLAGQIVYYQNSALAFLFWLMLGLAVVNWQKPIQEKVISFKDFPEMSLVFSTAVIIIGVTFAASYFFGIKFYLADVNYARAQRMAAGVEKTAVLEKAVRLNPGLSQYRTSLARAYMNEALNEQDTTKIQLFVAASINQAKVATDLSPNQVVSWETLGVVYREIRTMASGALDWGVKSFEKAISLESSNPVLYTELGKLYALTDNTEKAKTQFSLALQKKADYTDASIQEILLQEREGDLKGAVSKMEALVATYPYDAEVFFQMGRLYFNNNQITLAIEQFKRVILLSPNHSNAHYSLGVAYAAKGEKQLAIEEFEKVLGLNPGNQDVITKLEQLK